MVTSLPSRTILPLPRGWVHGGNFALGGVKGLLLKNIDGVIVVDCAEQQSQSVLERCWDIRPQAGSVGEPRFKALVVLSSAAKIRRRQTHHHGQVYLAAEHIPHFAAWFTQLIHTDGKGSR